MLFSYLAHVSLAFLLESREVMNFRVSLHSLISPFLQQDQIASRGRSS